MFAKIIRFLGLAATLGAMLHVFVIIMNMIYGEPINEILIISSICLSSLGLLLCFAAWREVGQIMYLISALSSLMLLLASIVAEVRPGSSDAIYGLGAIGIIAYLATIYHIIYASMK